MTAKPWYHEGLRFRCLECGRCCTGEPGYVWVTAAEIALLAAALQMEASAFEDAFVRTVGKRRSLVELPNGDCVFFDSGSSPLHGVRLPPGPVPDLAVLGVERLFPGGVGRDVPRLSRKRTRDTGRAGAD